MSIETLTKLATYTLGSSSSTITFENIPQTYTDLKLVVSARGDTTNSDIAITGVQTHYLRINGNLGTLHSSRYFYCDGASITSGSVSGETIWRAPGSTNSSVTASVFSSSELYISGYTNNTYKSAMFNFVTENNATTAGQFFSSFVYAGTEPITKIEILTSSGNFVANSTFTLYGVKAMRKAVGNSIKATGGAISFDGTYVYHTFNTTDFFTPTAPLVANYLVVAGGGGGGSRRGSGGGAGRSQEGNSGFSPGTSYLVTVGAGGAGGASGSANAGSSGNDSIFNLLTSLKGNGGGTDGGVGGTSGASFAGGSTAGGPNYGGGGGGGNSAVGANGTTTAGGAGGAGTSSTITGVSVTRAGGGGGGTYDGGTAGAGTNGGGNGGSGANPATAGSNGTPNYGGGGGGGGHYSVSGGGAAGGSGGSGVVIIRYKA